MNVFTSKRPGWLGLTPLVVFLCAYLLSSLLLRDFYTMPLSVAFIIAIVYAMLITPNLSLEERLTVFSRGASDSNLMLMLWIFMLSGAFAHTAKTVGAIDATVQLLLLALPTYLLLPGLFLASCIVSLSIGTSVGTLVALAPIGIGLADSLQLDRAMMAGLVVGGAFFGDNLSFISDTTIAATRLMGTNMREKFMTNILFALPAALICLSIYTFFGLDIDFSGHSFSDTNYTLVLPYLVVLVGALLGMNVILVLLLGIICGGAVSVLSGAIDFWGWIGSLGTGITGMGELIIVTLLAGGLLELMRHLGGFDYLLERLRKGIDSQRGAELSIASLVFLACLCTANNTIAVLSTGTMARDIADHYGIAPRRAASILDIFACSAQGIIPYGAQLLLVAGFGALSPIAVIPYLYYPLLLGLIALFVIIFRIKVQK